MSEDGLGEALEGLSSAERAHHDRLVATTSLLADISFADVLVLVPRPGDSGEPITPSPGDSSAQPKPPRATVGAALPGPPPGGPSFVVTAHSRPVTSQTVHPDDLLGRPLSATERPLAALALVGGASANGGAYLPEQRRWVQSLAVPVNCAERTVAVLVREFPSVSDRVWGRLETTYFGLFRRLAAMIADGTFPYAAGADEHDHSPRVGDGVIVLDAWQRATYLSPNAQSALRRLGVNRDPIGRRLAGVGIEPRALHLAASTSLPHTEEIERNGHNVVMRCLPLIGEDTLTGVLVLVRDITELRRADRLLITKTAALAEVHHRVKNNLQTVSSLLSLQSRWLKATEAKEALAESARRIRLIAAVHEILSEPDGDATPFESVAATLSSLLRESLAPPNSPLQINVTGTVGPMTSEMMTALAIVLNELVQNAVDHGFKAGAARRAPNAAAKTGADDRRDSEILIRLGREGAELQVSVTDNGCGMPDGELEEGLGLTLVRTLVENDLGGRLTHRSTPQGTTVELSAPLGAIEADRAASAAGDRQQ